MRFSQSIEYAMHVLSFLAKAETGKTVFIRNIAKAVLVPESYLRKVFQLLVRCGIVLSHRGAAGGVSLAREPAEITFKSVVEAVDGSVPFYTCQWMKRKCNLKGGCLLHKVFTQAREKMLNVLESYTLKDVITYMDQGNDEFPWLEVSE